MTQPVQLPKAGRPLKDIRLVVDASSVEKQVNDVNFAATTIEWQGGTPDATLQDATHVLNIVAIQAWDDDDSFIRWAFDHRGDTVTVGWKPHADSDFELECEATIPYFNIGGAVGGYLTTSLACPCTEPTAAV
jgi:hypothetical protein